MLVGVLLLGKQAMLVLPEQDSLLERQRERQRRGGTYQEVARDALAVAEVGGHTPRDVHHVQHLVSRARTCVRVRESANVRAEALQTTGRCATDRCGAGLMRQMRRWAHAAAGTAALAQRGGRQEQAP